MSHHQTVRSVFSWDSRFRGSFSSRLLGRSIPRRLQLVVGHQARLKPHLVSARAEDGGDAELHLEVEEVVPGVFEEQILPLKRNPFFSAFFFFFLTGRAAGRPAYQKQVHRVESAEFLGYDRVAWGAGVQQGRHQSSNVQACVPQWLVQHAQRRKHGTPLNMEAGMKTVRGRRRRLIITSVYSVVFTREKSLKKVNVLWYLLLLYDISITNLNINIFYWS